ncbi:MAG: hypothetical protein ABWY04_11640 [Arthrobacter sp.]
MKLAIVYSFRLRFQDNIHEVIIPADLLLEVPLDVETVRRVVEEDDALLAELFRDFLPQYRLMMKDPGFWSEELERDNQMIKLVEVI